MGELTSDLPIDERAAYPAPIRIALAARDALATPQLRIGLSMLAVGLIGVALYFVSHAISMNEVVQYIRGSQIRWVFIAVGLAVAGHGLRILRSREVIGWEATPRIDVVAQAVTGGQVINWLSPIRAGDVWRVLNIGQATNGKNSLLWTASSVVLEKGTDSMVLVVFGIVLLFSPLPDGISFPVTRLLVTVFLCMLGFSAISALGSSRLRDKLLARLPKLDTWLNQALPEIRVTHKPGRWLKLIGISTMIWLSGLLVNIALARALGVQVSLATQLLLLLTLQTTTVLAPVPGNVGVFPLIALAVLGAVGIDGSMAVAYGSVLYVVAYGTLLTVSALAFVPRLRPVFAGKTAQAEEFVADQPKAICLLGVQVDMISASDVVRETVTVAAAQQRAMITYVNAHGLNLAHDHPDLRDFYNHRAHRVFCDGFGVRWGARLAGLPMPTRFTPPDWIDDLAAACAQAGLSIFLLGDKTGTVERAAEKLQHSHPSLKIAGTHHGFFDKTPHSAENAQVVAAINQAKPDVLLVGFGMPHQEYWLRDNWHSLNANVALTVGALFGYLTGDMHRAPRWMTDHGLEWVGRLVVEPKRLWRRYVIGIPLFLLRVAGERLGLLRIDQG